MLPEHSQAHPYNALTPEVVLDAVESLGLRPTGALLALNSYENRVYQLALEEGAPVIAKFYRPQRWSRKAISEEHDFCFELREKEIPLISPLTFGNQTLHEHQGFMFALYPRMGGRAPESGDLDQIERLGLLLGRLHLQGAVSQFQQRSDFNLDSHGWQPREYLAKNRWLPPPLQESFLNVTQQLLTEIQQQLERVGPLEMIRIHGDFHMGNILYRDDLAYVLDFDDCCNGPRIQDIWMLFSGEGQEMSLQISVFLDAYETFCDFPRSQLVLIESFRSLRMLHYCAWLARRWSDPAFPQHFPWFNTELYWHEQLADWQAQVGLIRQSASSSWMV